MKAIQRLTDNREPGSLATKARERRFDLFRAFVADLDRPVRLIDIGGKPHYWKLLGVAGTGEFDITIVNVEPVDETDLPDGMSVVQADARDLEYATDSFDVAYSNSCIEHVGTDDDMARVAAEIRRVGRRYFVQTPALTFPLEPHFLFPFFALLPVATRVWLLQHYRLGYSGLKSPDREDALARVRSTRLLTKRHFERLFPDGRLECERYLGLAKSWMVMGGTK
jgi:hypothetical protein